MTDTGGPLGGRPSSGFPDSPFPAGSELRADPSGPATPGLAPARYEPARYEPPSWTTDTAGFPAAGPSASRHVSRVLDRHPYETGPLVDPEWWSRGTGDHLGSP